MGLKAVIPGASDINPVVDTLTITGVDNAALATDANGLVYGVTGPAGSVMRKSGTGTTDMYSVAFGGGVYVAVGAAGKLLTSTDKAIWTPRTSGLSTDLYNVKHNGTYFTAAGASGKIITSTDGITWTSRTSGVATALNGVVWATAQWVAVGASQVVLTSPDAVTWTSRTFGTTTTINGIVWNGTTLVALCNAGVLKTSTDGITWTSRTSGVATNLWRGVWDGTNFFVSGNSGVILSSTAGTTWAAKTSGVSYGLYDIGFGNSEYVAVGSAGGILNSTDGTTWTPKTSGVATDLQAVIYNSGWLVVGNSGVTLTSTDADTWTTVASEAWVASVPSGTGALLAADSATATNFTLSDLTVSQPVFTDSNKKLVSATSVGTGTIVALQSTGTFTAQLSGVTSGGAGTITWVRTGNIVVLYISQILATSNDATGNLSGLPPALWPTKGSQNPSAYYVVNNGNAYLGNISIRSTGDLVLVFNPINTLDGTVGITTTFTASGQKGIGGSTVVTYILN